MRSDLERLKDIHEAIANIDKYVVRGRAAFFEDELIQTWVLFHLQTIGEAARAMSDTFRSRYPDVPWQDVIDFRNLVVHEYFRVNFRVVWRIVESDLPLLRSRVVRMLNSEGLG
jgi:uncharacterized protein with HEPN domain